MGFKDLQDVGLLSWYLGNSCSQFKIFLQNKNIIMFDDQDMSNIYRSMFDGEQFFKNITKK
jgi:hypothetical protein